MKLILSRKGFDASAGKVPSPIFPDGKMLSLAIPENSTEAKAFPRYSDICYGDIDVGTLVEDLTNCEVMRNNPVHLDPDLNVDTLSRLPDWKPLFGQAGAAERHLLNHSVGHGDVFLFFGWFRRVVYANGKYHYQPQSPDLHVLFGWFQVDYRVQVAPKNSYPTWMQYHPHLNRGPYSNLDNLYVATDKLKLDGSITNISGAGIFTSYHDGLCLTNANSTRSIWRLPAWFYPENRASFLSFHGNLSRWSRMSSSVLLKTVGRGQEFVLDCEHYPEAHKWVRSIIGRKH